MHGFSNPPELGIEPMSLALAGRFLTTEPAGKPTQPFKMCPQDSKLENVSLLLAIPLFAFQ